MAYLKESDVSGATDVPFTKQPIGARFDQTATIEGEHDALMVCHQGIRWTYAELKRRADDFAAGASGGGSSSW
jgi:fatty-acyl-CoA synthase